MASQGHCKSVYPTEGKCTVVTRSDAVATIIFNEL